MLSIKYFYTRKFFTLIKASEVCSGIFNDQIPIALTFFETNSV